MDIKKIESIISGYMNELKSDGITSFAYSNDILYLYSGELSEKEYKFCDFMSELIIIKSIVKQRESDYLHSVRERIQRIQSNYETEIITYYPLACAFDSVCMLYENAVKGRE